MVDVRRPDEWSEGHVAGAIHIPLDQLAARLHELPADRELLFVCRGGNRSLTAARQAQHAGHTEVASVAGGTMAWQRQGLPIQRD
ncbi:MAG TPA: rhodanese-like domain-containing protein [Chloroflexota bacterium]|nr:rhodanese-like domain-containing protein [Chloroflexota bacterium]